MPSDKPTALPVPGSTLSAPYPFVRETVSLPDACEDGFGSIDVETWRPGTRVESKERRGPYYEDEFVCYAADGVGQMELSVVSVHRPGKYPTRVFFTRQWVDPDGKRFGKKKLRMTTVTAFLALAKGYRHDFELVKPKPIATNTYRAVRQMERMLPNAGIR